MWMFIVAAAVALPIVLLDGPSVTNDVQGEQAARVEFDSGTPSVMHEGKNHEEICDWTC